MTSLWPARFFYVVRLHPRYTLVILAAIVGLGVWTTRTSPSELDSGLGMLLFVQMFLASSGFLVRARRGHFDPLLVGPGDRTGTLVWHWLVSIAPGIAGWVCLAGAGYFMGSPAAVSALVGARAVALFIVSAIAWTTGFALTRGAAGVTWTVALLGLLVRHAELIGPPQAVAASSSIVARHAASLLVCPFLLIGNRPIIAPSAVCVAGLVSAVLLLSVWRFSARLDIYLVDRT